MVLNYALSTKHGVYFRECIAFDKDDFNCPKKYFTLLAIFSLTQSHELSVPNLDIIPEISCDETNIAIN